MRTFRVYLSSWSSGIASRGLAAFETASERWAWWTSPTRKFAFCRASRGEVVQQALREESTWCSSTSSRHQSAAACHLHRGSRGWPRRRSGSARSRPSMVGRHRLFAHPAGSDSSRKWAVSSCAAVGSRGARPQRQAGEAHQRSLRPCLLRRRRPLLMSLPPDDPDPDHVDVLNWLVRGAFQKTSFMSRRSVRPLCKLLMSGWKAFDGRVEKNSEPCSPLRMSRVLCRFRNTISEVGARWNR